MFYFSSESESFPFSQLLDNVHKFLKATDSDKLAIVCCAITALTYANKQGKEDTRTTIVETFISKWVRKKLVIDGEMFGGKLETNYLGMQTGKLVKGDEEFKV